MGSVILLSGIIFRPRRSATTILLILVTLMSVCLSMCVCVCLSATSSYTAQPIYFIFGEKVATHIRGGHDICLMTLCKRSRSPGGIEIISIFASI